MSFLPYNNLQFHRVDKLGWYQESTLIIEKKRVQKQEPMTIGHTLLTEDVSCIFKGICLGMHLTGCFARNYSNVTSLGA